ncbi:hypothetical protein MJM43_31430, partial [Salmonella enterica subsp. enterica serovar Montevideo]|nr:hypothetical protein [Salmonella enterica subsp. enterica serovar Montevideo]
IKLPWGAPHEEARAKRLAEGFDYVDVLPRMSLEEVARVLAGALTVRLGINSACAIRDLLLTSSEQALADKQQRRLTQAFCDVVD